MVVPVWFPDHLTVAEIQRQLGATLDGSESFVDLPNHVLVVDGLPKSQEAATNLREEYQRQFGKTFTLIYNPENQGKAAAAVRGIDALLAQADIDFIAVRDCDGDHLIDDLPNLYRAARHMQDAASAEGVMVIGCRTDIYKPVGFLRAQFEILLNRSIMDALAFALAQQGRVPNTQYFLGDTGVPDIQSGYKLYSRSVCELFLGKLKGEKVQHGLDVFRYGCEIIPFVECAVAGVPIGEAHRTTCYQLSSSYAGIQLARMYGSRMVWVCRRLGIGGPQARQILDNNLVRSTITTEPTGRQEAMAFRKHVLSAMGEEAAEEGRGDEIHRAAWC